MKRRANGYYWVKMDGRWLIAEYNYASNNPDRWNIFGYAAEYSDKELDEIGDPIEVPEKYK
jgi:hypothetical protein